MTNGFRTISIFHSLHHLMRRCLNVTLSPSLINLHLLTTETIAAGKLKDFTVPTESEFSGATKTEVGFPGGAVIKNPHTNAGDARDWGLIPGSGRCPKIGNGNPLQYSCLGNPMERGAWRATVHRVANSWTCQSTEHTHTNLKCQDLWTGHSRGWSIHTETWVKICNFLRKLGRVT